MAFSVKLIKLPFIKNLSARYSSFLTSEKVRPLEEYPEVEVIRNPPEWKYVERLLPLPIVPKPSKKAEYPSGWRPPTVGLHNVHELKYYVARNRNHMLPVYLERSFRGQRRITVVKRIQGDLWVLDKELKQAIDKTQSKRSVTRINEMSGQIRIHGDHVDFVREYLKSKGY